MTPQPDPTSAAAPDPKIPRPHLVASLAEVPTPEAILFDLDGTLVRTVHLRVAAWAAAFREIGIETDAAYLGGFIGSDGRMLAREVAHHYGHTLDDAGADALDKRAGAIFDELNRRPEPLPCASELLTALERSDLHWAIATSSQAGQVAVSVGALNLPAPPPITDGSHVAHAKPEPDLLLYAAEQLGVAPERCWYVGDSRWDMMASERAGMWGIGVATGADGRPRLLESGAVVALTDLTPILDELRARGLI